MLSGAPGDAMPTPPRRARLQRKVRAQLPWQSTRLSVASAYFRISAALGAVALLVGGTMALVSGAPLGASFAASWLVGAVTVAGWWRAGVLLGERRRDGGVVALLSLALPLVDAVATRGALGAGDLAVPVLGALVLLSCWRELR